MTQASPAQLAQTIQQLLTQHDGQFRPADFLNIAAELGFRLQPTPPDAPKLSYHSQQQPGAGVTAPGAADISEGMVWVCTEATMPKFTGS